MKKKSGILKNDLLIYLIIVGGSVLVSSFIYFISFAVWEAYDVSPFLDFIQLLLLSLSFSFSVTSFFTALYLGYANKNLKTSIVVFPSLIILSFFAQFFIGTIFMGNGVWNEAPFIARFSPFSIVPYGLVGYSFGKLFANIKDKQKIKWHALPRAIVMTILFSIILTFMSGFFAGDPMQENYKGDYHYFINRGVPFVFTGFSDKELATPVFIIKSPVDTHPDKPYIKIVDVFGLLKALAFYSLFTFLPSLLLTQHPFKKNQLIVWCGLFILMFSFTFFVWSQII